ncbi:MAG TPA: type IV pilus biogenesis/stability protein PilW [Burkholderiaceae bacterium]|nr:type IV pilus biogenesis/stability protein PilW [Burkholderiaceae bacterium]
MSARFAAGLLLAAAALLGGCATKTTVTSSVGDGKDIVTSSDETDASKRARIRLELASAYFGQGQTTTALDQVKLALQADPNSAPAYNLRGLIYANLGDDALAQESFRRALQLNPRDADAMQNYGYYLCQKQRYPEAAALFDQALAMPQYRDQIRTLVTKGVCEAHAGQLPEAEATLTRAYQLDPANPSTAVNLAEVLYRRGEYERARFYIRRVNAVASYTGAQTLWLAARIERRLGNRTGATDLGEQLRRRFPDSREASSFERGQFDE